MAFKVGTSDRPYSTIDGIPYLYDSPKASIYVRNLFKKIRSDEDAVDGSDRFLNTDITPFTGNQRMIYGGGKVFFGCPRWSNGGFDTNHGNVFALYPGRVHQNNKSLYGYLNDKVLKTDDKYFGSFSYSGDKDKNPGWDDGTPWELNNTIATSASLAGKSIAYTAGLLITGGPGYEDTTNNVTSAGSVFVNTDAHQFSGQGSVYHLPAFYGSYYYGTGSSGVGGLNGHMNNTNATGYSANYMGSTVSAAQGKMVVGFNPAMKTPSTDYGENNMVWFYNEVTDYYSPFNGSGKVIRMKDIPIAKWYHDNGSGNTNFGYSHDIGCGRIVVGAPGEDVLDDDGNLVGSNDLQGAIYIFDYRGNLLRRVANPTPNTVSAKGRWGQRVKIGGGRIVVGGYSQSCHVFDLDGNHINDLRQNAGISLGNYDSFGEAMDVGFGYIAIGAPSYFIQTGRVYLFDLDGNYLGIVTGYSTTEQYGTGLCLGPGALYVGGEGGTSVRGFCSGYELNRLEKGRGIFTPYDIQAMEDGDK